jgi:hypothetical protein
VLIERAARLMLYIELMDAQALKDKTMSERNSRQYLAWDAPRRTTSERGGQILRHPGWSAVVSDLNVILPIRQFDAR